MSDLLSSSRPHVGVLAALTMLCFILGCPSDPSNIEDLEAGDSGHDADADASMDVDASGDVEDTGADVDVCVPYSDQDICAEEDDVECGYLLDVDDGCGGTRAEVFCGQCSGHDECGIPEDNQCGCDSMDCDDLNADCGTHSDGCGGYTDECGEPCGEDESCEDQGGSHSCVDSDDCEPIETCEEAEAECGEPPDGCGGEVDDCPAECENHDGVTHTCLDYSCECDPTQSEIATFCNQEGDGEGSLCREHEITDGCTIDCGTCGDVPVVGDLACTGGTCG